MLSNYLDKKTSEEAVNGIYAGGEMGTLIRAYDWSKTSLGAIQAWSPTLQTVVNMMLQSPVPLVLLWGEDGIMIYNDPYSRFAGARHPFLLGSKVVEGWPEVADFNRNVMAKGLNGEALSYKDQQLTLYRNNVAEEVWMDLNYSPVLDEIGQPAGVLAIVVETSQRVKAELQLKESENRFRAIANESPVFIFLVGPEARVVFWNKHYLDYTGQSHEEAIDGSWKEVVHPDDTDMVLKVYNEAFQALKPYTVECRFRGQDGQYRWVLWKGAPRFLPNGEFVSYMGTGIDIHDRKTIEDALKESEARFRKMADSAPLFVWLSGPNLRINYVNQTWCHFLGLPPQDVIEYGMIDAIEPDDLLNYRAQYRSAIAKHAPFSIESRIRNVNGETRWLLNQGSPLFLPNGELTGYIGTSVDITALKAAETQLENNLEREKLIRKIVEVTSQSFDTDFILTTIAREVGEYMGVDRGSVSRYSMINGELVLNVSAQYVREGCLPVDEADVRQISDAVRHLNPEAMQEGKEQITNIPDQEQYIQYLRDRMAKFSGSLPGLTTDQLIELIRKYGVQSALRVNIYYRGTPYGNISVSQCSHNRIWTQDEIDLLKTLAEHAGSAIYQAELYRQAEETALKEQLARQESESYARQLEASNRELEQFATIASHDLSEPLRKIQVLSEMLVDKVPEEGHDYLKRISSATSRMRALMDDLLTLSRINRAGRPFMPIDLDEIIQTVLDDLQVSARESGASFQVGPLRTIHGDESQIRQLFQNLIGNAIKYHRDGVAPLVSLSGQLAGGHYKITVEDNGIGIQAAYYERIFEPFQRLHGMSKYPGTGMGLAICRKIVERHEGSLTVESQPNQGSRFTVSLPAGL